MTGALEYLRQRRLQAWTFVFQVLLMTWVLPLAGAAPTIRSALLRHGRSVRLPPEGWSQLSYRVENPDSRRVALRVVLRPDRGGATVFEKEHTLAPRTAVQDRVLVTIPAHTPHTLHLYEGDRRLAFEKLAATATPLRGRALLFFIDNGVETGGAGALNSVKTLLSDIEITRVRGEDSPEHWAGYGNAAAVVVVEPDFEEISALQFDALADFVHHGGTLILTSPKGILSAADTPLAELLPVTPLRIRPVEGLPELGEWVAEHRLWTGEADPRRPTPALVQDPAGIPLLESTPLGDGVTTLEHGELPLCRWRRVGLGRVGMVAVNPNVESMRQNGVRDAVWNHLLAWARPPFCLSQPEAGHALRRILALLTGFHIPDAALIRNVLLAYLLLLILILSGGFILKRHATAWGVAALTAGAVTTGIFLAAARQNAGRPRHSAAVMDLCMSSSHRFRGGYAAVSLCSRSDSRPDVSTTDPQVLLRALPRAPRDSRATTIALPAPLRVARRGDRMIAPRLSLQALKPRTLASLYERAAVGLPTTPTLRLAGNQLSLDPWQLPDWLHSDRTAVSLLLPGGLVPVGLRRGKTLALNLGAQLVTLDTLAVDIKAFLDSGVFPSPCLAVQRPWSEPLRAIGLDLAHFTGRGNTVAFIPIRTVFAPGPLSIPPAMIRVTPVNTLPGNRRGPGITSGILATSTAHYVCYQACLPAALADLRVETARVQCDALNQGGNVIFRVGLVPAAYVGMPADDRCWEQAIKAERTTATAAHFTVGDRRIVTPQLGTIRLVVQLSQKRVLREVLQTRRANQWAITRIQLQVTGRVPNAEQPRKF